jgi:hypothetical protein
VLRGTPAVLPRLVDDLAVVVGGSVDDVLVVPVTALLGLVDREAIAVAVGAVLGNILLAALAGARLDDPDVLAVTIRTGVRVEDPDNDALTSAVGEAPAIEALVDSSDGPGLSGRSASDGGSDDRLGCDSGGHGRATERNVNGEKDVVGNGLTTLEDAITTAELRVITRALNVTLVKGHTVGVGVVNGVTAVAVVVIDTEERTAITEVGADVQIHGSRRTSEAEGREISGRANAAEKNEVADNSGEASSVGGSGGWS